MAILNAVLWCWQVKGGSSQVKRPPDARGSVFVSGNAIMRGGYEPGDWVFRPIVTGHSGLS